MSRIFAFLLFWVQLCQTLSLTLSLAVSLALSHAEQFYWFFHPLKYEKEELLPLLLMLYGKKKLLFYHHLRIFKRERNLSSFLAFKNKFSLKREIWHYEIMWLHDFIMMCVWWKVVREMRADEKYRKKILVYFLGRNENK